MEVTQRKLVLTFGTAGKEEVNLTINNPGTQITGSDIKTAMDTIVTSGALGAETPATNVQGAKYVIQQVDNVTLA